MAAAGKRNEPTNPPARLRPGSVLIVCEGDRDRALITGLIKQTDQWPRADIRVAGSIEKIRSAVEQLSRQDGLRLLAGVVILRDPDSDKPDSIDDWFRDKWSILGLEVPPGLGVWTRPETGPAAMGYCIGVGNPPQGNPELLLVSHLESLGKMKCVRNYFECLGHSQPKEKSLLKAWLAGQLQAYAAGLRPKAEISFKTAAEEGTTLLGEEFWEPLQPFKQALLAGPWDSSDFK